MYRMGQKEVDRIAKIIESKKLFRYGIGGECEAVKPIGIAASTCAKGVRLRITPRISGDRPIERIYRLKSAPTTPNPRPAR